VPDARTPAQDRILDAAEAVFADKGYRGGALNDVAVAAGYTRAGLLHHYRSKETLLLAILDRRDERLHALESIPPTATLLELLEELPALGSQVLKYRTLVQLGHIVTAEASPGHPAYDWCVRRERKLRSDLAAAVENSKVRGELPAGIDSEILAALVIGAFEGLEAQWLLDDSVDVAGALEIFTMMVRGLRP
jgi:AcrR family transcriptional regulator